MKHSLLFWSRKSHCWAGVYLSAVTLLWLGEMALLPAVYEPRFEVASPSPAVSSVGTPAVSVQDVLDRFSHERLSPELGAGLKLSFQPLFILLCVTGIHLLLGRNRRPGKEKERAATLDAVRTGETCLYERADDPCLAGRLASLGFLPGVAVRMLRNAKRGPLLVLARHTRVALGREIASGIVVARKG